MARRFVDSPWVARARRAGLVIGAVALVAAVYARCGRRPAFLSLAYDVDGPSPASGSRVLFHLHGYADNAAHASRLGPELRAAGLPDDVSLVFVNGPYASGFGRTWGDTPKELAVSQERVRALVRALALDRGVAPENVIVGGFSQGAQVATDVVAAEPALTAVASMSGCNAPRVAELAAREGLRALVSHGRRDSICPFAGSRALAKRLEDAKRNVTFVEFDGNHAIPPEVVRALAKFLAAAP